MLTTVRGTYENGQVILEEALSVNRAKVLVTVVEELKTIDKKNTHKPRKAGSMTGTFSLGADFNDPLNDFKDYM